MSQAPLGPTRLSCSLRINSSGSGSRPVRKGASADFATDAPAAAEERALLESSTPSVARPR
jgi:hypothetical protein